MSIYEKGVEVELCVDLTHYHPSLKPGVEGKTTPPAGYWSNLSNKFVTVQFDDEKASVDQVVTALGKAGYTVPSYQKSD